MKSTGFLSRLPAIALAATVLALPGCGKTGKLSGKVLYKGNPVPRAKIVFLCDGGKLLDATADDSGQYAVRNVPLGQVRVGVKNFTEGMAENMSQYMHNQANKQGPKEKAAGDIQQSMEGMKKNVGAGGSGFVPLPDKAIDPEKSGIVIDVKGGSQEQDIVVTD
jgi:hypothetical protein